MPSHAGLVAGRWAALTLAEQLGNVGSEVDRAVRDARAAAVDLGTVPVNT